jgi:hypothetical protein
MKYLKLTKPIKTVVRSYQKEADGTFSKDADGNRVVTTEREITIPGVEIPQFESLQEAVQKAGSEDAVLAAINEYTKGVAVGPVRIVGNKFSTEDKDEVVVQEGLSLAKLANPFEDRRGAGNAVNKAKAQQFDALKAALESARSSGKSDEEAAAELIAMLKANAI